MSDELAAPRPTHHSSPITRHSHRARVAPGGEGGGTDGAGMIRVVLVDDQPLVRQGLRMRLALEPDISVVGEAGDGATALSLAQDGSPDVVVMDVAMPGMDGIAATAALRRLAPRIAVVIHTLHDDAQAQ